MTTKHSKKPLSPIRQVPLSGTSMCYHLLQWYVNFAVLLLLEMIHLECQASVALHSATRTRLPSNRTLHFPAEVAILVLPLLLSVTFFAQFPILLLGALLLPTGILLLVPPQESGTTLPSSVSPSREPSPARGSHESHNPDSSKVREASAAVPPLAALTTYRAHMVLLTIICILAVDFRVFPRTLAKCETFGVSLVRGYGIRIKTVADCR